MGFWIRRVLSDTRSPWGVPAFRALLLSSKKARYTQLTKATYYRVASLGRHVPPGSTTAHPIIAARPYYRVASLGCHVPPGSSTAHPIIAARHSRPVGTLKALEARPSLVDATTSGGCAARPTAFGPTSASCEYSQ